MSEPKWTPMIGLRRVAVRVAIRLPFVVFGWALFLWLAAPVLNFLVVNLAIMAMIALVSVVPGTAIGHGMSYGMTDAAGIIGFSVAFIVVVGILLGMWVGTEVASWLRPINDWQLGISHMAAAGWASLWAIKATVLEE